VLTDPLQGKTPLWKVFWVYGVAVSIGYSFLGLLLDPLNSTSIGLYTAIGLGLGVVQSIMMWQCAFNGKSRAVGRLVRASVVIGLISIPLMLYLLFHYASAIAF
jgi:hypothetical protein